MKETKIYTVGSALLDSDIGAFDKFVLKSDYDAMLETLLIKLSGCSVGALSNTEKTIADQRITKDNPYWSASLGDTYNAVDREIANRKDAARYGWIRARAHKSNGLQIDMAGYSLLSIAALDSVIDKAIEAERNNTTEKQT